MPARRSAHILVAALSLAVELTLTGCGSGDVPSKEEFVKVLRRITDPPIDQNLAECTYDKVVDDPVLLSAAMKDASVKLPDDVSKQLSRRLRQCVEDRADKATTTTRKN